MTARELRVDACIVGGGVAGAALAFRLAHLGHRVAVIERSLHDGPLRGEALRAGVWEVLDHLEITREVLEAGARQVHRTQLCWRSDRVELRNHEPPQLAVVRPQFDAALLRTARDAGAIVLQPAVAIGAQRTGDAWIVAAEQGGELIHVHARLVADASGRAAWRRSTRALTTPRSFALHGLWQLSRRSRGTAPIATRRELSLSMRAPLDGRGLPSAGGVIDGLEDWRDARLEAIADAWIGGTPAGSGRYAVTAVVDSETTRPTERYLACLAASHVFRTLPQHAELVDAIECSEVTGQVSDAATEDGLFRVGDAATVVDPLSSAGLSSAFGSALHASCAIHTLLVHPDRGALVRRFYEEARTADHERHQRWAGQLIAAARWAHEPFWRRRSDGATAELPTDAPEPRPSREPPLRVALSDGVELAELPYVAGDVIETRLGVSSRAHETRFIWVSGVAVAPLLAPLVEQPMAPSALLARWRDVPSGQRRALLTWLIDNRIVQPVNDDAE